MFAASDIAVTIADSLGIETALVLDTDYSVTLNANQETSPGGTVTYPISGTPLAVGSKLSIIGDLDYDQPLDLPSGGNFSPLALENQLDRMTMQLQQLEERLSRALLVPVNSTADVQLPNPEPNELIGWDSTGDNLANYALSELATGIAYGTMRFDTFVGDGTTTQFALTEDPAALANLDVSLAGVTQVPGTDYTLTSATLVFTTAPTNGVAILARYGRALPISGPTDSSAVTHVATGAGAVATTVQAKLRESVSVFDFMTAAQIADALSNTASLDVTAAITAALAASKTVFFPAGTYRVVSTITMASGRRLVGTGPSSSIIKCICSGYGGTFIQMAGGNNFLENMAVSGDSTSQGTLVRLSATNEYEFTGWMTLRDVNIYGGRVGLDMNSVFGVLVDNCRVFANYRGVRIVPSYDGIGDNGYVTTITFNKCYINQNLDYGFALSPTLLSKNIVLRDSVIEDNAGAASGHQAAITKATPLIIDNCYFELVPAIPAVRFTDCETIISAVYVNGTGGFDFGSGSNTANITRYYGTATTDKIYANGTTLQTLTVTDSNIPGTSTINASKLKFVNSTINGAFYRQFASNLDLMLTDGDLTNSSRISSMVALKRTVTATINANTTAALIADYLLPNTWNSDFTVGVANFLDSYNPGLILTVQCATTGSAQYINVLATNTTGSNITVTSKALRVLLMKGTAMAI